MPEEKIRTDFDPNGTAKPPSSNVRTVYGAAVAGKIIAGGEMDFDKSHGFRKSQSNGRKAIPTFLASEALSSATENF